MQNKTFYLTTTLPYVNAPLHMGHALEIIRADAIARHKELAGYSVFFNTGTDEHGVKIYTKAIDAGLTPQEFVDKGFETFKEQVARFGVSPRIHYIRTTDNKHVTAAQTFWQRVADNGFIYKKTYQAKYCVGCESEKTDSELVDGFCPEHPGIALSLIDEENYFFKYSAFGDKLLAFYEKNPNFIVPEFRFNEMKAFVARGLQDFSISRLKTKMPWGIPVPGDPEHVMYVWFDALVNYIATVGWGSDPELFQKYWVLGTPTQYCGKDNTRFQGIMWQAMLMAAEVPNSHQIVVNGFITGEGGVRMSKTLGNVVDPRDIVAEYGTDALRLFLLKEVSSFEDSPFTLERFKEAYNSNLANGLGNLVSRILALSEKYFVTDAEKRSVELTVNDALNMETDPFINHFFDDFNIKSACEVVWSNISRLDEKIAKEESFKVIKTDAQAGKKMLLDYVHKLADIAFQLKPIIPDTAEKIIACLLENKKPEQPLFLRK